MKAGYVVFVLSMLLLVGCTGGSSGSGDGTNWKSGTQGVTVDFIQNSPPDTIYAGEVYSLALEVRNRGAHPLDRDDLNVSLFFSGFDDTLLTGVNDITANVLDKKTVTNPEGGFEIVDLDFGVQIYDDTDSLPQDIRVTACYEYETVAGLDICVDPDPTKDDDDSCRPSGASGAGGQGAPVAITSVTQEALKGKTRFTMRLQNVGTGDVFRGSDCLNIDRREKDIVAFQGASIGNIPLTCSADSTGEIRLVNGVGTLTCTGDVDVNNPAYLTSLGIRVTYNYKDSVSKRITIKRIE